MHKLYHTVLTMPESRALKLAQYLIRAHSSPLLFISSAQFVPNYVASLIYFTALLGFFLSVQFAQSFVIKVY